MWDLPTTFEDRYVDMRGLYKFLTALLFNLFLPSFLTFANVTLVFSKLTKALSIFDLITAHAHYDISLLSFISVILFRCRT